MSNNQTAKKPLSAYEKIVLIIALICVGVLFAFKAISMQAQPDKVITYTVNNSAVSTVSQESLSEKVNINTADKERLTSLKGIGESKAEAIISYREANGPFSDITELMNVDGIGQKTFENIKDMICVE